MTMVGVQREMKLIAHRANVNGPNPLTENHPDSVDSAISMGFGVEIDLRMINSKFYLGHDEPQYEIPLQWLFDRVDDLWIHCKNLKCLKHLNSSYLDLNYFWHQTDDFTLTSKNYIWTYPGKEITTDSIAVMPETSISLDNFSALSKWNCFGICSDYVGLIR